MIRIGGLQKTSLLDYPGVIAAIVFLAGCNFRCGFCHNPDLIEVDTQKEYLSEKDFFTFLKKRQGLLEGVCITGGEPLIYKELADFLKKIKKLAYLIKIDTNGFNPQFLQELIDQGLIDYIAMDIKGSIDQYHEITNSKIDVNKIQKSIKIIMASGLPYEFRTTVLPKFHSLENIEKIAKIIKGADQYYLQRFNNKKTYDPSFQKELTFSDKELAKMKKITLKYVNNCQIRG